MLTFALANGALAQLVEHRTENPCVPGSIPGGTTHQGLGFVKIPSPFILATIFYLTFENMRKNTNYKKDLTTSLFYLKCQYLLGLQRVRCFVKTSLNTSLNRSLFL